MRRIPTEFNIWTVSSSLETSLGDLEWRAFVPQGLLQGLDVLLLVVDLLHGLAEVRLELVVSIVGLGDSLLERHVRVVPVAPHLVRTLNNDHCYICSLPCTTLVIKTYLGDQVVHFSSKPLGR